MRHWVTGHWHETHWTSGHWIEGEHAVRRMVGVGRRPMRVGLSGEWVAEPAEWDGRLGVRLEGRARWRQAQPVTLASLGVRVGLGADLAMPEAQTRAHAAVANPGQRVVVVESDEDELVLIR